MRQRIPGEMQQTAAPLTGFGGGWRSQRRAYPQLRSGLKISPERGLPTFSPSQRAQRGSRVQGSPEAIAKRREALLRRVGGAVG